MSKTCTIWTSETTYVDIETGEVLTKHQAIGKGTIYRIHKTIKKVKYNEYKTRGHVTYTRECKRKEQGKLEFGDGTN